MKKSIICLVATAIVIASCSKKKQNCYTCVTTHKVYTSLDVGSLVRTFYDSTSQCDKSEGDIYAIEQKGLNTVYTNDSFYTTAIKCHQ